MTMIQCHSCWSYSTYKCMKSLLQSIGLFNRLIVLRLLPPVEPASHRNIWMRRAQKPKNLFYPYLTAWLFFFFGGGLRGAWCWSAESPKWRAPSLNPVSPLFYSPSCGICFLVMLPPPRAAASISPWFWFSSSCFPVLFWHKSAKSHGCEKIPSIYWMVYMQTYDWNDFGNVCKKEMCGIIPAFGALFLQSFKCSYAAIFLYLQPHFKLAFRPIFPP